MYSDKITRPRSLVFGGAQDALQRRVGSEDVTLHVGDGDAKRRTLEDRSKPHLALAQRLFGLLTLGEERLANRLLFAENALRDLVGEARGDLGEHGRHAWLCQVEIRDGQTRRQLATEDLERATHGLRPGVPDFDQLDPHRLRLDPGRRAPR